MIRTEACGQATVRLTSCEDRVEVRRCPGGPLLVRGADTVHDEDGVAHPVTRPVVAVCACAKTQRWPWCDGTHKVLPGRGAWSTHPSQPVPDVTPARGRGLL